MRKRCGTVDLGKLGERRAKEFLGREGFRTVAVNYRCRIGEIDLVAMDGETVVFVEVKSRRGASRGRAEDKVTSSKKRRLTTLARFFLAEKGWSGRPARFDVVVVNWGQTADRSLVHYRDAFEASSAW